MMSKPTQENPNYASIREIQLALEGANYHLLWDYSYSFQRKFVIWWGRHYHTNDLVDNLIM